MGALMTNTGACGVNGVPASSVPHQLTTGIAASGAGGLFMWCVSYINLGPNDFALMTDASNGAVVAAIAKIDLTLLPFSSIQQSEFRSMTDQGAGGRAKPMGLPGWTSTGPPPP